MFIVAHRVHAITHPSVDQPGTKRVLSFPFIPAVTRTTRADIEQAAASEPFSTLPLALVPNAYASWKPPVMHYGWEANVKLLLDLAEEMGCLSRKENMAKDALKQYYKDRFPHMDLEAHHDADKKDHDGNVPKWAGINKYDSMTNVVRLVARQLGIEFPLRQLRVIIVLKEGQDTIISLYTNYNLRANIPPEEDIRRLAERLRISEQPKWYLDDMQWTWTRRV